MKPFNLKEYLENPFRKIITRDGRPVRIISTNAKLFSPGPDCNIYPVVALIKARSTNSGKRPTNEEILLCYSTNGHVIESRTDRSDLFFETVKVSGWVNIYTSTISGETTTGSIYKTKEEALRTAAGKDNYLDTIFIEWEEYN